MLGKLFNRPEATISSMDELPALKQFFDGKQHVVKFTNMDVCDTFAITLFKQCGINALFDNSKTVENHLVSENVSVDEIDEDSRDEIVEKNQVKLDRNYPFINMKLDIRNEKDGSAKATFTVDKALQNYWDPKVEILPDSDDDEEPSVDDIAATIDDDDIDEEDNAEV